MHYGLAARVASALHFLFSNQKRPTENVSGVFVVLCLGDLVVFIATNKEAKDIQTQSNHKDHAGCQS